MRTTFKAGSHACGDNRRIAVNATSDQNATLPPESVATRLPAALGCFRLGGFHQVASRCDTASCCYCWPAEGRAALELASQGM
jgi:hypothetical protein